MNPAHRSWCSILGGATLVAATCCNVASAAGPPSNKPGNPGKSSKTTLSITRDVDGTIRFDGVNDSRKPGVVFEGVIRAQLPLSDIQCNFPAPACGGSPGPGDESWIDTSGGDSQSIPFRLDVTDPNAGAALDFRSPPGVAIEVTFTSPSDPELITIGPDAVPATGSTITIAGLSFVPEPSPVHVQIFDDGIAGNGIGDGLAMADSEVIRPVDDPDTHLLYFSTFEVPFDPDSPPVLRKGLSSDQGLSWTTESTGMLMALGGECAFDENSHETPGVVYFDDQYHMYFSAQKADHPACPLAGPFPYQGIGHAASPDGITWTKDPDPVVVTSTDPDSLNGNYWRAWNVMEPSPVVFENKLYLFFVANGPQPGACGGLNSIGVAVSTDGYVFDDYPKAFYDAFPNLSEDPGWDPAWAPPFQAYNSATHHPNGQPGCTPATDPTVYEPDAREYGGYGGVDAVVVEDVIHLFYSIVTNNNDGGYSLVGVHHAITQDGLHVIPDFSDALIFQRSDFPGEADTELKSPSVLFEDGEFRMYLEGNRIAWGVDAIEWRYNVLRSTVIDEPQYHQ